MEDAEILGSSFNEKILEKFKTEGDLSISKLRLKWWEKLSEDTRKLLKEDNKYYLHQSLSTPCLNVLSECKDVYIMDVSGKRYLDFHGNCVHNVGFSNPKVIQAIKDQLDKLTFCPRRYTNEIAIKLAKKLTELTSGNLSRCLLSPGGAEAVEMALKLAMGYTKRYKILSWWDSFHGATFATISIGGEAIFRGEISLLPGTIHVHPPDCYRCPYGHESQEKCSFTCIEIVKSVIEKEGGDLCAMIAEPIRGAHAIVPPLNYWREIKKICTEYGILLIFDEILIGLGRTGKMFAYEHFNIVPDILVLGKSLGGGILPIAGIVARDDLNVMGHRALGHFTHEKNPVLCAAALATIRVLQEENLVENAAKIGEYALKRMNEMKEFHQLIGDVRGKGLLLAIELVKDKKRKIRASEEGELVMYKCLEKGLNLKLTMGNILALTPALTITKEQMDKALDIIDEALSEVEKNYY
ncbi:MAG: aspartate aminotransferase family protein [Candidatus Bathyarchaeia archaeon]|nr:aspartate aminotransferase family protein [Candidatus Bathyarchaeota archaeon]